MQVRVFEGEDMTSTLKKVKETLGPDALILSTRTVPRKKLGILGRPMTEITAAVESQPPAPAKGHWLQKKSNRRSPATYPNAGQSTRQPADLTYDELWNNNDQDPASPLPREDSPSREADFSLTAEVLSLRKQLKAAGLETIQDEIADLKGLILGLTNTRTTTQGLANAPDIARHPARLLETDGPFGPLNATLDRLDIKQEAALALNSKAARLLTPAQVHDPRELQRFLAESITGLIKVSGPILPDTAGPKKVALLGPTGVGKTTTIAKLAAAHLANYGNKVALVTIDTYRIAAVEQLKVYGEIMGLPVEVVMDPEELPNVFARHQDKELILIDTAGRSPKDEVSIKELATFLSEEHGTENHLVLSATTRESDMRQAVRRFSRLPIHSFIFTKLDECDSLGVILNVSIGCERPLSYLTNGQKVPEDIILADPRKVSALIMEPSVTNEDPTTFS